ncbi:MAG: ABC transporter ATP-binding protein [Dactylosporangium sp.]|nr:ABC transporter ATP-binding protein [Dactylosporangium sp.]NNJ63143.1 ABC transporter ATP-binding protein [Dactylosporangium sp.]
MAESTGPLLAVEDLRVRFPVRSTGLVRRHSGEVSAVDGVSFAIGRGETLGLVGESGCGKTTTGLALLRLVEPSAGRVAFDGTEVTTLGARALRALRRRMAMIFQDPYASLNPRMSIASIITEPLEIHGLHRGRQHRRRRVGELLELVGLSPDYGNRYPHEFSGGQRQRIGIARALATEPDFIVADEPIAALDVSIQAQIMNLLEDLQDTLGLTYLFIAHDLAAVGHISDRVAVMYLGRVVEVADRAALFEAPRHPYTRALLSAVPVARPQVERRRDRIILGGEVPSAADPPSGCRFRTRCPVVFDRCSVVDPVLARQQDGHQVACHHWPGIA